MDQANTYSVMVSDPQPGETGVYRNPIVKDGLSENSSPQVDNLQKALLHSFEAHPDRETLGNWNKESNSYEFITYTLSTAVGSALETLNLVPEKVDERGIRIRPVGIYARNRREWTLVDVACQLYGITSVPFYDTLGPASIKYGIDLTSVSVCFCQSNTADVLAKTDQLASLTTIVTFDPLSNETQANLENRGIKIYGFQEFVDIGRMNARPYPTIDPKSILTICFTSGTTGNPKAALQTHQNFTAMVSIFTKQQEYQLTSEDVHVSYLPLPHTFERAVHTAVLSQGGQIVFGSAFTIKEDLARAKPTIFISVPRIYNRFYEGINQMVKTFPPELQDYFDKTVAEKIQKLHQTGQTKSDVDSKVFAKTQAMVGGRVRYMITGAAPISAEVLDFLKVVFCCPIVEGFGQTESTAASFLTHLNERKSGFVGGPTVMNEFKLVDVPEMEYLSTDKNEDGESVPRGEVCLRGPGRFAGYFHDAEKTNEAVDKDGWLHTGDIAALLPNGGLKVIDRKKNLFKLQQGEYVSPEKIENSYVRTRGVLECFVHGESTHVFVVGIVVPEPNYVKAFAQKTNLEGTHEELCVNPQVVSHYLQNLTAQGKQDGLVGFEQIKQLHLEPRIFAEVGLLTDTQKLQRFQARKHYKDIIEQLYAKA